MTWLRLCTYVAGGAAVALSFVVPPAAPALMPAGTFALGYATRWPQDTKPPPEKRIGGTPGGTP